MRMPLIAANWKMFKTAYEADEYAKIFKNIYRDTDVQAVICCPYTCINTVRKALIGTDIMVGAQNVFYEPQGAFTGEISVAQLMETGVDFCIVGHSERRQYFNETNETVNLKLKALLDTSIRPILCVGESLDIREEGSQNDYVKVQLIKAFDGIDPLKAQKVVIAYEPIWAIGTGRTATAAQAGEMCAYIRNVLIDLYGEDIADEIIIQYGGSVKPENISEIMDEPEIDGALVGGASLDPIQFMQIIDF